MNAFEQIGDYPATSGRLKFIRNESLAKPIKVALIGDSTLDNDIWVQKDRPYREKTATVTHQAAQALASAVLKFNIDIANFAIDGATTADITNWCPLGKVVRDQDHPLGTRINQMHVATSWQPDVAVLSVAGNNYREALQGTLRENIALPQLLLRQTPEQAQATIKDAFDDVKTQLLAQYKNIIDILINGNPQLKRIVLMSQYFPELTQFTLYFIYTGFSHVARAEGIRQSAFTAMQDTMNELYREILAHCASKDKEFVLVDVTSSMNPLDNNHTCQIEPNARGAKIMGRLIAEAVRYLMHHKRMTPKFR